MKCDSCDALQLETSQSSSALTEIPVQSVKSVNQSLAVL